MRASRFDRQQEQTRTLVRQNFRAEPVHFVGLRALYWYEGRSAW
jgi:hypothetical protein